MTINQYSQECKCKNPQQILASRMQQHMRNLIQLDSVGCNHAMQGWYNRHTSINVIYYIRKLKSKSNIVISIDAEQAFDKM